MQNHDKIIYVIVLDYINQEVNNLKVNAIHYKNRFIQDLMLK